MTYVVLLLLTPKMLSLPFDFLKTMTSCPGLTDKLHSTIDLITGSAECPASSSVAGFPRWASPLQGKDFLQACVYFHQQQSYVMPLLNLMTSNNPKMDWCNTRYLNYGHNVIFKLDYTLSWFNDYFAAQKKTNGSRSGGFFYWMFIKYGMRSYG